METIYRVLTTNDVEDYKSIRLELLEENPTSFGSDHLEESQFDQERWIARLNNPNATTIGAYINNEIVGICVLVGNPRRKMKHKSTLNSMYVKASFRKQGIAKGIFNKAYEILKEKNVEYMNLSVMSDNLPAIVAYLKEGFVEEGRESKAIKDNDTYYDLVLMQKKL